MNPLDPYYFIVMAKQYKQNPSEYVRLLENDFKLVSEVTESDKIKLRLFIGSELSEHSFHELAINLLLNNIDYCKKIGEAAGEAMCYSNIGVCYGYLGDNHKVIEYQQKAIHILRNMSDIYARRAEGICYKSIAVAHAELNRFCDGINYLEKAIDIFREVGDKLKEKECEALLIIFRRC